MVITMKSRDAPIGEAQLMDKGGQGGYILVLQQPFAGDELRARGMDEGRGGSYYHE